MSESERCRLAMFSRVSLGQLSVSHAGRLLGLSERQSRRLWRRYCERGDAGLVHGLRGRVGNAAKDSLREAVLGRYRERYVGFGAAHASEHLSREGLPVSRQTLWRWLKSEGLSVRTRRGSRHRIRRERRACVGELVQMDGSTHAWFGPEVEPCVLFVMIDDATGEVLCRFYASEDTFSAFDLVGRYVRKHGLPVGLYVDRDSIYRVNDVKAREVGALIGKPPLTQFGRAMKQLGVALTCAHSPQAKGRVERMNGTLQDRLVKELALEGITEMSAANQFLEQRFLPRLNERFARVPASGVNAHRGVEAGVRLSEVLCVIENRTVGRDWCVRYRGRVLQIDRSHEGLSLAGRKVEVLMDGRGKLKLHYRGRVLRWRACSAGSWLSVGALSSSGEGLAQASPRAALSVACGDVGGSKASCVSCEARSNQLKKPRWSCDARRWRPGLDHPWRRAACQARCVAASLAPLAPPPLRVLDRPGG